MKYFRISGNKQTEVTRERYISEMKEAGFWLGDKQEPCSFNYGDVGYKMEAANG